MKQNLFLQWLAKETETNWWHDSADPAEIRSGLENGAVGITTNPPLIAASLGANPEQWQSLLKDLDRSLPSDQKAEETARIITKQVAAIMKPIYDESKGKHGYVCAQVNPKTPGDTEGMMKMAKRLHAWAPNIAVKLPVTNAGLEVLEECAAQGITVVGTVSFTLPQVLAVAERYRKGYNRAIKAGISPARCIAVVMVGRIDDYIRDVATDSKANVSEQDIIQCGNLIMKRAVSIFEEQKYEAELMPAGMRGVYHATELAGMKVTMSIHPKIQAMLAELKGPFETKPNITDKSVLDRLRTIPEFIKAYEPDGLVPKEFIAFGVVQKTLTQFVETGWKHLETF